jgi:uncharacterized membrane protein YagU involved in acid resistance
MRNPKHPYQKLIQGAAAGLIATLPMTIFMRSTWKRLPAEEQYALPPRLITRSLVGPGRFWKMSRRGQTAIILVLHFLFGAMAGSMYGMLEEKVPLQRSVKGPLAGMVVWTASYLGWVPALGIMPPATGQPWRRNVMMIVAHLIWGMTLGVFARAMNSGKDYITIK